MKLYTLGNKVWGGFWESSKAESRWQITVLGCDVVMTTIINTGSEISLRNK